MRASLQAAHEADLALYVITDTGLAGGIDRVPAIAAEAVRGGAGILQVREKDASDADVAELVRAVRDAIRSAIGAEAASRVPLVVNDRLAVAAELGCHVHIGQSDTAAREARAALPPHLMVGLSVSTPDQVRAAREEGIADILGIGPIHATTTKPNTPDPLGTQGLRACLRPLAGSAEAPRAVAIGGITEQNAEEIAATGVDGLCVVSAVIAADDPHGAAARLRQRIAAGHTRAPATPEQSDPTPQS
ncbi:MAG: thiamine phosphate synthase [Brachybacterium sp.]|nr:thiamine phosphate synthase [Brachybacterium sp.]